MDEETFDKEVAEYYDKVIEKGYHNNKEYLSDLSGIIKKGEKVLELGCGTGKILLELLKRGVFVEGLDTSKSMIEKLKSKNNKVAVHVSELRDFNLTKEYDYVLSCNGPFSIKRDELESYILEKDEFVKILKKYSKIAKKGLLINIGTEKPELKIPLSDTEIFIHKEGKVKDYTIMINLIFQDDALKANKIFIKRRYKINEVLKNAKVKDLGNFKLIQL